MKYDIMIERLQWMIFVMTGICLATKVQQWSQGNAPCPLAKTGMNVTTDSMVKCIALIQIHNFSQSARVSFDNVTGLCVAHDVTNKPGDEHTYQVTETDKKIWIKTLTVTKNGSVVFGSVADVIAKIRNGADMRLQLGSDMFYEPLSAIVRVRNGQTYICFPTPFIVRKSSWDTFDPKGIWDFTSPCTDGKVYIHQQYLGDPEVIGTKVVFKAIALFTREMACEHSNPVYCNDRTGRGTCPDKMDLLRAIQQGAGVKIVKDSEGVRIITRIEFEEDLSSSTVQITGLYPWHPSLKLSPFDSFANPLYWLFMLFSTNGQYETRRYYIGKHRKVFDRTSYHTYDWLVDRAWTQVYSNKTPDNISELKSKILAGCRIRIMFDSYVMEADNIVVDTTGRVTAQLLSQVETSTQTKFTDGYWKWIELSTDGIMDIALYKVGANELKSKTQHTVGATWFAEQRIWRSVLTNDFNDTTTGSLGELKLAIGAGSRLRCLVKYLSGSEANNTLAVSADNIVLSDNGHLSAQVFRYVKLVTKSYWRFLLIKTTGRITEFRWLTGEHTYQGTSFDKAAYIDWLVDERFFVVLLCVFFFPETE